MKATKSTLILAVVAMLPSLVIIDEAAGHGYYVGPINKTVTVLGCCGASRTSINVKIARRYYAPYQSQYPLALWGYHWHKGEGIYCVDRNNQHYDNNCDDEEWKCSWTTRDTPYATCREGDEDCIDEAEEEGFSNYDDFIREWGSDEEGFYIDYYARDETCGWVLVP